MSRYVWPKDIPAAKRIQNELREKVRIHPLQKSLSSIAGVDAAFHGERVIAVASLLAYPSLIHKTDAISTEKIRFPYVPGFLSFREGHAIISAIRKFRHIPDVIIVDGQGIAHPRRLGIASHIGVLLDVPTIGCAKSRLVGEYSEPALRKASGRLSCIKENRSALY